MKYLLKNNKVEYCGNKKQLIEYVQNHYKDEFWVKQNSKKFDTDFGCFKLTLEILGFELADKMSDKEYNKTHKYKAKRKGK